MSNEVQTDLDHVLLSPEFFQNPYPVYAQIRSQDPVFWSERRQAWFITRYTDVKAILADPQRFSSIGSHVHLFNQLPASEQIRLQPLKEHYLAGGLINSDPPDHTRLRAMLNKTFTPRMIEKLHDPVQEIVNALLDEFEPAGGMDIIRAFAYPLPAIVTAEMLGVPRGDYLHFKKWSEDMMEFSQGGVIQVEAAERAQQSILELKDYFRYHLAKRHAHPREDVLSGLAAAQARGDVHSEGELLATCVTLLRAGFETTTNLVGNSLMALFTHPDQMQILREDLSLLENAVEEFLRYDGTLQAIRRVATDQVEINGKHIQKNQLVYALIGSANRDPGQFDHPEELDLHRSRRENQHLAFGYGIHFCLGAPLARLEGAIALRSLLTRFPKMQLADSAPTWHENMIVRGVTRLPVTF